MTKVGPLDVRIPGRRSSLQVQDRADGLINVGHFALTEVADQLTKALGVDRRYLLDEHQSRFAADLDFGPE